ncbi:MAG TPA: hypothetical protein VJN95_08745 [Gemmatimonadales bacterium]|nr:hypothetical protein [Gemmatimonadales bacterium]
MEGTKLAYYLGVIGAVLFNLAGASLGLSAALVTWIGFAAGMTTGLGSALTSGINPTSHKIAWLTVIAQVLTVLVGYAGLVGPTVTHIAQAVLIVLATATAIGHPAPVNPATR